MRYVAIIHKEQDTSYGVSFPDLPGCISAGETADQALDRAAEALALHLSGMCEDGEGIPTPRTFENIVVDDDYDMTGAMLCYVTAIEDLGTTKPVNLSLDVGLIKAIDSEAKRRGVTRSAFLATAARHEIGTASVGPGIAVHKDASGRFPVHKTTEASVRGSGKKRA